MPPEFKPAPNPETPDREAVWTRVSPMLEHGNFAELRRLMDLDPSVAEFVRTVDLEKTVKAVMAACGNRYFLTPEPRIKALVFLASLGLPEVLNRYHVRGAVIQVQCEIIANGRFDQLDELAAAGVPTDIHDPQVQSAVTVAARRHVLDGNADGFKKFEARFGIPVSAIGLDDVIDGYEKLLRLKASPSELSKFANAFPQFIGRIRKGEEMKRASVFEKGLGLLPLLEAGKFSEAERFAASAGLSRAQFDAEVDHAIRFLLNVFGESDAGAKLLRLRHVLGVSADRFEAEAERLIRENSIGDDERFKRSVGISWDAARRIQQLSGLPDDRLAEAFADGQARHVDGIEPNESDQMRDVPKKIQSFRSLPGMTADLADRLERRVGYAYAVKCFATPRFVFGLNLDAMSYLDNPTVRRAAVEGTRRALRYHNQRNIAELESVNQFLDSRDIPRVEWAEARDEAMAAAKDALLGLRANNFHLIAETLAMPEDDRRILLDETRDEVQSKVLMLVKNGPARDAIFTLYDFDWDTFPLCDIPARELLGTKDPALADRAKNDPWRPSFEALLKLQARSANEEHDPWVTDFFPLIDRSGRPGGGLDRESPTDGALLVDYVKTFGMANLLNVSRIFFGLKKGPFSSLPETDRRMVVDLVGQKAARMDRENLINELRLLRLRMQTELLGDAVPKKIETALGEEMFLVLRGSTTWDRGDRPSEVLARWKETVAAARAKAVHLEQEAVRAIADQDDAAAETYYAQADAEREKVAVAPGYEEVTFAVARRVRGETKAGQKETEEQEILDLIRAHDRNDVTPIQRVMASYDGLARAFEEMTRTGSVGLAIFNLNRPRAAGPIPQNLESLSPAERDRSLVEYLENAARVPSSEMAADFLRNASVIHLAQVTPRNWMDEMAGAGVYRNRELRVRQRAAFVSQYLKEHYLNPAQVPGHTGHAPFSETLRLALERAWHADGDATTNVLLRTDARIAEIRRSQTRISKETADVTLVPVQGPLRIYAGDIGDACYTSQHAAIAGGECPRVRAMVYVTNRGKGTERLAGSVLLVETRLDFSNERVLLLRANNPRQNLVGGLDAPSLVRQTVDAVVEIAKRRRIKHVAVVCDDAGGASSNREDVSAAYENAYGNKSVVELKNEPETNFNGYDVWNSNGESPTVIVWTNDDPEAT